MLAASNATRGTYQAAGLTTKRLDGDAELRKIASAGRDWMFSVGRKIDMESEYLASYVSKALTHSLRVPFMFGVGAIERRRPGRSVIQGLKGID